MRSKNPLKPVFWATAMVFAVMLGLAVMPLAVLPTACLAEGLSFEWGGRLKLEGTASRPGEDSYFQAVGGGTFLDGRGDLRLTNKTFTGSTGWFEVHYELGVSVGDTRRKTDALRGLAPGLFDSGISPAPTINDDTSLLRLTGILDDEPGRYIYQRLDRLSYTWQPSWGVLRLGRQALTWGNGLIFNPLDLFNPFEPTDFVRDYKMGDDMIYAQTYLTDTLGLELVGVPRRDMNDGDPAWNRSSLGAKLHYAPGSTEYGLFMAKHYEDQVLGLGAVGYLGDAAYRINASWTLLDDEDGLGGYLSLVANMDYSWVWADQNWYGLVELYFCGLGYDSDYGRALMDPDLGSRLQRGEIYTLGRIYLATELQYEIHPLVKLYLNLINNLNDPSGVIQPRAVWDATQNSQVTIGCTLYYGGDDTEYGGFGLAGSDYLADPVPNAYLWYTYYF